MILGLYNVKKTEILAIENTEYSFFDIIKTQNQRC